jgi:hypothetical protein
MFGELFAIVAGDRVAAIGDGLEQTDYRRRTKPAVRRAALRSQARRDLHSVKVSMAW